MSFAQYLDKRPVYGSDVFLANTAEVIGDVEVGNESSIWFQSVIRGDVNYIRIGKRSNLQDFSMVHVATNGCPTIIGDDVTVGHRATLHACTVDDLVLVGMGAIIMDGSHVQERSIVAAGSVITPGKTFEAESLILGNPARVVRRLKPEELTALEASSKRYVDLSRLFMKQKNYCSMIE